MSILSWQNLRHETRIVIRIATRGTLTRLAATTLVLGLCWAVGAGRWVPLVAVAILLFEMAACLIALLEPPSDREMPTWLACAMWATNVGSTVVFLLPGAVLATQPELPLVLAGFFWIFGIYVHNSNVFVALPLYNWSQMTPAFVLGFGVLARTAEAHWLPGQLMNWLAVGGLSLIYAAQTVDTIRIQKEVQQDLARARTEACARLEALERMVRHDPVTGLLNRQAFDREVEELLSRPNGRTLACFLIDLDGFKAVNDTYSHAAGDMVLRIVAERLRVALGRDGIAARLGGDEFALAAPDLPSAEAALELAGTLLQEIERPIRHGETVLCISGSIGVTVASGTGAARTGGNEVAALCSEADQAMFRAKAAARAGAVRAPVLYDPEAFPARPTLEDRQRLAEAIGARRIRPRYQPVVDLETGATMGFEALARWVTPERELPPADFLPLVAEFGLHGDLLVAMAEQVVADIEALIADGIDPGRVSINVPEVALATLSGRQALDRLLDRPLLRGHVVLEITEDVFIARSADAIRGSIAHFRAAGIGVALDDFGTGYASLQHLREVEFDEIKIDRSFVTDLGQDPAAEVLVAGLVTIGRSLGVRMIAEGVETEAQRRHLLRLGCRWAQGYLLGQAMPYAELRARLTGEQRPGTAPRRPAA